MTLGLMVERNQGGARRAGDIRGTIRPSVIGLHKSVPAMASGTQPYQTITASTA